jgi:hypothetical protein
LLREARDRLGQAFFLQKLQLRGAFAARENQTVAASKIFGRSHFHGFHAKAFEHGRVRFKISLHR